MSTDPYHPFLNYLNSRDKYFPLHPELWLTSKGSVPTRHWFMSCLRKFFPKEIAGQSLRSGGATSLAEAGADLETIQAAGRWSSEHFESIFEIIQYLSTPFSSGAPRTNLSIRLILNSFFSRFFHRYAHSLFTSNFLLCFQFFIFSPFFLLKPKNITFFIAL